MDVRAGPYQFTLPDQDGVTPRPPKRNSYAPDPLARIGPFEFHALISSGTIEESKEHIRWTTKYAARFRDVEFNNVPGFTLDGTGVCSRRIDLNSRLPAIRC